MNRGTKDSYNQISGNEDIIEYDINLCNTDNNIIIEIPLVKSLYGNIDLSIIYNHQTRNQNNEFGKGYKLNYYSRAYYNGAYVEYEEDKIISVYNNTEIIDYITYAKNLDYEDEFESLVVYDNYGNSKTILNDYNYPSNIYLRNGSNLEFTFDNTKRITKIKDLLTLDEVLFEYLSNKIIITNKMNDNNNPILNTVELLYDSDNNLYDIKYKKNNITIKEITITNVSLYKELCVYHLNELINKFRYNYNSLDKITSIYDKDGLILSFEYYQDNTKAYDKYNNYKTYYFKNNKLSYSIDNHNVLDYLEYDSNDNLIYTNSNIKLNDYVGEMIYNISSNYQLNLNKDMYYTLLIETDSSKTLTFKNNNVITTYNINGYKLISFKPNGLIEIIFNNINNILKIKLIENKDFFKYEYNNRGYKTKEQYLAKIIEYLYDSSGNIISIDDSNIIKTYTYDIKNNMLTESYDNEIHKEYSYNNYNNLVSYEDDYNHITYSYSHNKITYVTTNNLDTEYYEYDSNLNLSEDGIMENNGVRYNLNEYTYDSNYRIIKKRKKDHYQIDEYQIDINTSYNTNDIEKELSYDNGNDTYKFKYFYNSNNDLIEIKYLDQTIKTITYDETYSERINSVTKYGNIESYVYNSNNTLSSIIKNNETINIIYNQYSDIYRIFQNGLLDYEYSYD